VAKVQLTNLVKQYSAFYAVDHVSLTIEHASFVALVGPSAAARPPR